MKNIIFAPHADDEIIGCHSILEFGGIHNLVLFGNADALNDSLLSSAIFGFKSALMEEWLEKNKIKDYDTVLFFPDPYTELHPLHKKIGLLGVKYMFEGYKVFFYTTNMNTNYLQEVKLKNKKKALEIAYEKKKDLWRYDWKYFLFEGYVNYNAIRV